MNKSHISTLPATKRTTARRPTLWKSRLSKWELWAWVRGRLWRQIKRENHKPENYLWRVSRDSHALPKTFRTTWELAAQGKCSASWSWGLTHIMVASLRNAIAGNSVLRYKMCLDFLKNAQTQITIWTFSPQSFLSKHHKRKKPGGQNVQKCCLSPRVFAGFLQNNRSYLSTCRGTNAWNFLNSSFSLVFPGKFWRWRTIIIEQCIRV